LANRLLKQRMDDPVTGPDEQNKKDNIFKHIVLLPFEISKIGSDSFFPSIQEKLATPSCGDQAIR
jgi:hypothetical protein